MQAIPDSTQCDSVSGDKKEKKKKSTKRKKRRAEGKDSKTVKKKKTGKGKSKLSSRSRSNTKGGDGAEDPDLDLNIELKPMGDYINDREEMLDQMFACIQAEKLTAMLPGVLQGVPVTQVKALCLTELEGMSKKRIRYILAGQEMLSSSGTDESDSETELAPPNEECDSPFNQMADSTSNLQASDNQLEDSIEHQSEHSYESGGGSVEHEYMEQEYEEEAVYEGSEQEYAEEQEVVYQSDEQAEEQMEDEYVVQEGEGSDTQYVEEQQEGEESDTQYVEEQYEGEEMEYAEEEVEQQVDEMPQDADADKRTCEDDDNVDHDKRESDKEDNADDRGEETPMEEETIVDVPKRMRKDVEDADVEEGEVFDDDEEVQGEEAKKDETAEEIQGEEAKKNETAEALHGEEAKKDGTTEELHRDETQKDATTEITTTQEADKKEIDAQTHPKPVSMETQNSASCEQISTTGHDHQESDDKMTTVKESTESLPVHGKLDTVEQGKEGSLEQKEGIVEQGRKGALEHDKQNTREHDKQDNFEQGKSDSQSAGNNTEQRSKIIVEHVMNDPIKQEEVNTPEQGHQDTEKDRGKEDRGKEDRGKEDQGKEDQGQEVKEPGQEVKEGVTMEESNKTESSEDQIDQVSGLDGGGNDMDTDTKRSENLTYVDKVIACAEISQSGNVTKSNVMDEKNQIAVDAGSSNQIVRTSSEKSCDSVGTSVAGVEQISVVSKDVCDDTVQSDQKGSVRHAEPSVHIAKGDDIYDNVSNIAKVESSIVSQETDKSCVIDAQNVTESVVTMETTSKIDGDGQIAKEIDKTDTMSINASESESGSITDDEESSSGSDDEDMAQTSAPVHASEGEVQPGSSEELEMLELELRARAIRSLMKKMGKH